MGLDYAPIMDLQPSERNVVTAMIPDSPMISENDWNQIQQYYQRNAPDSLQTNALPIVDTLKQFESISWHQPGKAIPQITLAQYQKNKKGKDIFWIADRSANLFKISKTLEAEDSVQIGSPASAIRHFGDSILILKMGIMDPNDQAKGSLVYLNTEDNSITNVLDSLRRPVYFDRGDFNRDGLIDYVICEFGNYTGGLTVFQNLGNSKFKRHAINKLPGSRKVAVKDFNNDGLPDIMALITQANEQLTLFTNAGNFNFRITTLLRFPPVYGSSYFELADFNQDGKDDIIYSNGDNADYSSILKPYHGIRIYLNEGFNQFKESFFFPMNGASQTLTNDYDDDGDLDIAIISFFPDLKKYPQYGFMYLENNGDLTFHSFTTMLAASGRWMTASCEDIDGDQDVDIILAALNFDKGVTNALAIKWKEKPTSLLILKNKSKKN